VAASGAHKQLVIAYRRERTIESYIQIRRKFPEVEIQISRFGGIGGIDALFALEEDFEKQGVPPTGVVDSLKALDPDGLKEWQATRETAGHRHG